MLVLFMQLSHKPKSGFLVSTHMMYGLEKGIKKSLESNVLQMMTSMECLSLLSTKGLERNAF